MQKDTRFVRYTDIRWDHGHDIIESRAEQAIALENLKRYFDLNYKKVKISGWLDDDVHKCLHVVLRLDGEVYRSIEIEGAIRGTVIVEMEDSSALKLDPIAQLRLSWLKKLGLPKDFPTSEEISIDHGVLKIELCATF